MAEELFIPKLGQTVEEVTLVKWLVEDGARVSHGQPVMEVETDKAVFPVEANAKGTIHIGPYQEGQVLPVLTVVALIGRPEDKFVKGVVKIESVETAGDLGAGSVEQGAAPTPGPDALIPEHPITFASPRARKLAAEKGVDLAAVAPTGYGGARVAERDVLAFLAQAPRATPIAQRMAAESGVDLRRVSGTGPGGRIVKEDIARAAQPQSSIPSASLQGRFAVVNPQSEIVERIPLKGVRLIIAERMAASVQSTARVTLVTEADATEFVAARERIKAKVEQEWGFAPGYNDLLAKIVAAALRRFPYMNARFAYPAGLSLSKPGGAGQTPEAIEILGRVNLGMAVDTERGLLVPVVRDADQLSLRQFGLEFRRLAEAARTGRALPDDLTGGTFTLTNLGMYEIDAFTPVINLPEAAILGIGRIAPKVVPYNGQPAIRSMWTLSLAFDHRLTDGAPAARFLQAIKQMVEEPYLLLTA
jgi:pyruvate dehydrogenase E2 component (dihydrolipoamide acetyltransferase)